MPIQETLILAVTRTLGGVCIAGMTMQADTVTGLRWVRPIRERGHVLVGDITSAQRAPLRPFDVVTFSLLRPRPIPPHIEDWITDFVRHRPRVLRRLRGNRRAAFLHKYLDAAPHQVLINQERSLCLVRPDWVRGAFRLDGDSGQLEARLSFGLVGRSYVGSLAKGGLSVTDVYWRALGRDWLPESGGWTDFDGGDLEARYGVREVYLAVGLTRSYEGNLKPIILGVHTLPECDVALDCDNL